MTKRAFGRREGEEQIPWLMHTCPRLLPRWSSKRLLRNKGLRLFLAGLDWSADFAAGTVHGMEVGIGLPCTNCSEQRCEIVCGELLRSESYYVSGREITLDRPSLDRKSTRLNSSHGYISYAVFCLKKKNIIQDFLHKGNETTLVYDKLAEWAATLTTTNIAHVIFLTTDVSFSKSLSKALPNRVFRQIILGDCSPEVAKRFVINHLDADAED